jgi:glycosyltransferase involved in cell wall biosynthesis
MKISIITVCFNAERTIAETITSVCEQNFKNIEYIVVDGASSDKTVQCVKNHPNFHQINSFVSERDNGIFDAMNKGISIATGDVIGLLNADDVYVDDTVLSQVATVFLDKKIDACYSDLVYVKQFDSSKVVRYWKSRDYTPGLFERGWMPAHPTFFVRREVYEKFGAFDLSFQKQADFELTLRLLQVYKLRTQYIPKIWVKMRLGGASNQGLLKVIYSNVGAYRACKKHGLSIHIAPWFIFTKILSRIPQFLKRPG